VLIFVRRGLRVLLFARDRAIGEPSVPAQRERRP
jgi:hypothetical protein